MTLEKIITLANKAVQLRFTIMVRSLRATGCQLPVYVIPYDDHKFDLPENCFWLENEEIFSWLDSFNAFRACRKYLCFLEENYQFVDSDIVFLRNPAEVLEPLHGFITSCSHWRYAGHTYTDESLSLMKSKTTMWQSQIFNSGQFACDSKLYTIDTLKTTCEGRYRNTLLIKTNEYKDQPALNLLVQLSSVKINNLTLPPYHMESTWAGDYFRTEGRVEDTDPNKYWKDQKIKPYLIHWAGCEVYKNYQIDKEFTKYLNNKEWEEWTEYGKKQKRNSEQQLKGVKPLLRKIRKAVQLIISGN